jgi:hypothetical protein
MKKLVGILIMTLFFTVAILPAIGTMNESNYNYVSLNHNDSVEWSMTYGGDEGDKFWDVAETLDGGYIASGTKEISNIHYPWILKVDSEGNEMWDWSISEFTVDGEVLDITYCWQSDVLPISDGGYIISLTALETNYNDEVYDFGGIAKLNSEGDEEWMIIYNDGFEQTIRNEYFMEVEDGILGVGDYTNPLELDPGQAHDTSGCFFKINNNGEIIWENEYNYGEFVDKLNGICITNDGGFLLAGGVGIEEDIYWDGWLVKTDSQGEKEWEKTFGGQFNDFLWGITKTNNDYIITGWTASFGFGNVDIWVLKTDSNGNIIWNKTIGEHQYEIGYNFDTIDDGILIPMMINNMFSKESYVIKMDFDGNIDWKHEYSMDTKAYFNCICSTSDDGCIASGILGGWDSSNSDALLVKYASFENQRPNKPDTPTGPNRGDPDTEYTFSTSTTDPDGDSLQYKWDWGDGNYSYWLDTNDATYAWSYKNNFEIRVKAMDENGGESDWSEPLAFSTPKTKIFDNTLFERLLSRFPILKILI